MSRGKPLLYGIIDELKKLNKFEEDMVSARNHRELIEYLFSDILISKSSPFKHIKAPHLLEPLESLSPNSPCEYITIMKPVSMGATTCIADTYYRYIANEKVEKVMKTLRQKYPNWSIK
jgi:hypothetical protein